MKIKLLALLACLAITYTTFAQSHKNEIGIQSDNDSYLAQGSDRYYTDGIFVYFRHALKVDGTKLKNKVLGFEAGQKIFNPQGGNIPGPQYIDRPFAGYLYAGATLNLLYANESNLKLGAQVGIIGPGSGAEGTQNTVHEWFNFYHPTGWEYQIHDGAVINLSAEYNKLLTRGDGIDLSFTGYGNLGMGFSGAGAGLLVRAGNFNQLFNSVSTQSTASNIDSKDLLHPHEFFAYYKPVLNYVAYDATIQGSLSSDKSSAPLQVTSNRQPIVLSNEVGVAYTASHWVLSFAAIYHTKDTKEQVRVHQWGAATALYRF